MKKPKKAAAPAPAANPDTTQTRYRTNHDHFDITKHPENLLIRLFEHCTKPVKGGTANEHKSWWRVKEEYLRKDAEPAQSHADVACGTRQTRQYGKGGDIEVDRWQLVDVRITSAAKRGRLDLEAIERLRPQDGASIVAELKRLAVPPTRKRKSAAVLSEDGQGAELGEQPAETQTQAPKLSKKCSQTEADLWESIKSPTAPTQYSLRSTTFEGCISHTGLLFVAHKRRWKAIRPTKYLPGESDANADRHRAFVAERKILNLREFSGRNKSSTHTAAIRLQLEGTLECCLICLLDVIKAQNNPLEEVDLATVPSTSGCTATSQRRPAVSSGCQPAPQIDEGSQVEQPQRQHQYSLHENAFLPCLGELLCRGKGGTYHACDTAAQFIACRMHPDSAWLNNSRSLEIQSATTASSCQEALHKLLTLFAVFNTSELKVADIAAHATVDAQPPCWMTGSPAKAVSGVLQLPPELRLPALLLLEHRTAVAGSLATSPIAIQLDSNTESWESGDMEYVITPSFRQVRRPWPLTLHPYAFDVYGASMTDLDAEPQLVGRFGFVLDNEQRTGWHGKLTFLPSMSQLEPFGDQDVVRTFPKVSAILLQAFWQDPSAGSLLQMFTEALKPPASGQVVENPAVLREDTHILKAVTERCVFRICLPDGSSSRLEVTGTAQSSNSYCVTLNEALSSGGTAVDNAPEPVPSSGVRAAVGTIAASGQLRSHTTTGEGTLDSAEQVILSIKGVPDNCSQHKPAPTLLDHKALSEDKLAETRCGKAHNDPTAPITLSPTPATGGHSHAGSSVEGIFDKRRCPGMALRVAEQPESNTALTHEAYQEDAELLLHIAHADSNEPNNSRVCSELRTIDNNFLQRYQNGRPPSHKRIETFQHDHKGIAVRATADIEQSTVVGVYGGDIYASISVHMSAQQSGRTSGKHAIVSSSLAQHLKAEFTAVVVDPTDDWYKFDRFTGFKMHLLNEPDAGSLPNCILVASAVPLADAVQGLIHVETIRPVSKGEELTVCYGPKYQRRNQACYQCNADCTFHSTGCWR